MTTDDLQRMFFGDGLVKAVTSIVAVAHQMGNPETYESAQQKLQGIRILIDSMEMPPTLKADLCLRLSNDIGRLQRAGIRPARYAEFGLQPPTTNPEPLT